MGVEPTASLVLSESGLPVAYRATNEVAGLSKSASFSSGGRNRTHTRWFKASEPTVSRPRNIRVPCGTRTHVAGLEDQCLRRSAKGTYQRKERELNPQGIAARPFSRRLPSPIGLPFRFSHVTSSEMCGPNVSRAPAARQQSDNRHYKPACLGPWSCAIARDFHLSARTLQASTFASTVHLRWA